MKTSDGNEQLDKTGPEGQAKQWTKDVCVEHLGSVLNGVEAPGDAIYLTLTRRHSYWDHMCKTLMVRTSGNTSYTRRCCMLMRRE